MVELTKRALRWHGTVMRHLQQRDEHNLNHSKSPPNSNVFLCAKVTVGNAEDKVSYFRGCLQNVRIGSPGNNKLEVSGEKGLVQCSTVRVWNFLCAGYRWRR